MTEYINKQDAYRIALHDGGPVCAEKIAQLEPLKIDLRPDVTDTNIIRQLPTITIDIKPATINPKTLSWGGVDLEELKKTCEKVNTVRVKNDVNSEWTDMPVDEFFRMLGNKTMMEGER